MGAGRYRSAESVPLPSNHAGGGRAGEEGPCNDTVSSNCLGSAWTWMGALAVIWVVWTLVVLPGPSSHCCLPSYGYGLDFPRVYLVRPINTTAKIYDIYAQRVI